MRIAAVIAVREGTEYLHNCLTYLQANTIKALIIDNGLSGPGRRIVESARYSDTVAAVEELPARDVFCLDDQLLKKEEMIRSFDGDWVIHHDIDELLQSDREGESLRDAILRADLSGANAINFLEMVFIPCDAPYATTPDGWPETLSYYHFAPAPNRLMRARKTAASLSMLPTSGRTGQGGGHLLFGDALILHQSNFFLRHYIVTDQAHARRKYVERRFSESEVARGWHRNRIGFSPGDFAFPDAGRLKRLPHRHSAAFDLSEPHKDHYWQWSPRDEAGR